MQAYQDFQRTAYYLNETLMSSNKSEVLHIRIKTTQKLEINSITTAVYEMPISFFHLYQISKIYLYRQPGLPHNDPHNYPVR